MFDPSNLADYGALIFVFGCLTLMVYWLFQLIRYAVDSLTSVANRIQDGEENRDKLLERLTDQVDLQSESTKAHLLTAQSQAKALESLVKTIQDGRSETSAIVETAIGSVSTAIETINSGQTEVLRGVMEDAVRRYTAQIEQRIERIERLPDEWKVWFVSLTETTRAEFSRGLDRIVSELEAREKPEQPEEQRSNGQSG